MDNLIEFFLKVGEVKRLKQRGLVLRDMKDPALVGGDSFRSVLMAWVLAQSENSGLNTNRLIKIILLHDLVGGYAGDLTPYESLISKTDQENFNSIEHSFSSEQTFNLNLSNAFSEATLGIILILAFFNSLIFPYNIFSLFVFTPRLYH